MISFLSCFCSYSTDFLFQSIANPRYFVGSPGKRHEFLADGHTYWPLGQKTDTPGESGIHSKVRKTYGRSVHLLQHRLTVLYLACLQIPCQLTWDFAIADVSSWCLMCSPLVQCFFFSQAMPYHRIPPLEHHFISLLLINVWITSALTSMTFEQS